MPDFLAPGSSGHEVKVLQASLRFLLGARLSVDGYYGPQTANWVRRFQAARGLEASGSCDSATWYTLAKEISPPERHLQILLPWSILQVREGDRVLRAYPLERPLVKFTPGITWLDSLPRNRKGPHLLKLGNGVVIDLDPGDNKRRHLCRSAVKVESDDFFPLLKRRMPVLINPLRYRPEQLRLPPNLTRTELAEWAGISLKRLEATFERMEEGGFVPASRPFWPAFWAYPLQGPEEWIACVPYLMGVVLAPELIKTWAPYIRKWRLLALTVSSGQALPRPAAGCHGWCFVPSPPEALIALSPFPSKQNRAKDLVQALILPNAEAVAAIPSAALNLDWYAVPVGFCNSGQLTSVRRHLHPQRLLLTAGGKEVKAAAHLAKEERLGGLLLTSCPPDGTWIRMWLDL